MVVKCFIAPSDYRIEWHFHLGSRHISFQLLLNMYQVIFQSLPIFRSGTKTEDKPKHDFGITILALG
jgi:hypothetical protein